MKDNQSWGEMYADWARQERYQRQRAKDMERNLDHWRKSGLTWEQRQAVYRLRGKQMQMEQQ